MHPALAPGNVAVITGGASGIGLATAQLLAAAGLRVCVADHAVDRLDRARTMLVQAGAKPDDVMTAAVDVSEPAQLRNLADRVQNDLGPVAVLMNNAGIQPGSSIFDAQGNWGTILGVNLWGVIRGTQVFAPRMIAAGRAGLIINTGSKQGITTPPGDPAYNIAKAGVKVFTEALQHELRNSPGSNVEARLFIPGFVYTGLTAQGRTEKPAGAWTAEQTAEYLLAALERPEFYILCPDNDVDRRTDAKRILWAAGDVAENRPPLSRWHPDYHKVFADWLAAD